MACFTPKEQTTIQQAYTEIMSRKSSLRQKIDAIDVLNAEMSPYTLFQEARAGYIEALSMSSEPDEIILTKEEQSFAVLKAKQKAIAKGGSPDRINTGKPILSSLVLDGQKYMLIHAENNIRIFRQKDNKEILSIPIKEENIKARKNLILSSLSKELEQRFENEPDYPIESRTLQDHIVYEISKKHPVEPDGTIPIERKLFKAKGQAGLFGAVDNAFSVLANTKKQEDRDIIMEQIKQFIPKSIRDIILNDDDTNQQVEFNDNMSHFLEMFKNLKVPTEEVWRENWKLDDNAALKQTKFGLYKAPNYLQLIGTYRSKKTGLIGKTEDITNEIASTQQLVLNPAIDEIVKFYSIKAMADMDKLREDLNNLDYDELGSALNVDAVTAVKMKDDFIEHGFVPASSFIRDASRDAWSQVGLIVNSDINMDIQEGLIATLNTLIRSTLISSGYIEYNTKESEQKAFSDFVRKENNYDKADFKKKAEIDGIIKEKYQELAEKYDFDGKHLSMFKRIDGQFNEETQDYKKIFKAINKLKYLSENEGRRTVSLDPIDEDQRTIKNKTYNVNPDMNKFRIQQNQVTWSYKEDFRAIYDQYQDTVIEQDDSKETIAQKKELKHTLLSSLGYEDIELGKHHISEIKTIRANNDKLERELDILIGSYVGLLNKQFYIPWAEVASGRMMIQSDMNPQESKLIRSFIQMDSDSAAKYAGHSFEMFEKDFSDKNGATLNMMEMAIAQALDMDPDKNSKASVLKDVRDVVDVTGSEITFGTSGLGPTLKRIVELSEQKTLSAEENTELGSLYNKVFDKGEGHHGLQAARMIVRLAKWKKNNDDHGPFNNDLTIETDAITSGMMLTLMQIVDADSVKMLAKGGIFTKDTQEKWAKYTDKWLKIKYKINKTTFEKDKNGKVVFGPASLIEAGNFHQSVKENPKKALKDHPGADRTIASITKSALNDEVYQDLYKTIGLDMQDSVETTKKNVLTRLNNIWPKLEALKKIDDKTYEQEETIKILQDELDYLAVQKNLLDVVGEINPKILRKIAKDPVMVFIYGSTIKSIRSKLGMSVGRDNFISSIKTQYQLRYKQDSGETLEPGEKVELQNSTKFINSVLKMYKKKLAYTQKRPFNEDWDLEYKTENDDGNIIAVVPKNDDTWGSRPLYEKLMFLDVNKLTQQVLQDAVNDTFGDAIEGAFDRRTASVEKYRNMMKSTELLTFELFRAKTETYKRKILEAGKLISKADVNNMLKELELSGHGHDVPTGDADSAKKRLPLINTESTGSSGQASTTLTFNTDDIMDKDGNIKKEAYNHQARLYAYLTSKQFISNTGAAPTISIHQMDSRAITITIEGNAWLSIYDAVVQASHPENVNESNRVYNTKIFEQNSQRNILGDNIKKLDFMLGDLMKQIKNGDKDAQKEFDNIQRRMSSSEEITIKNYTYSYQNGKEIGLYVRSPKLYMNKGQYNGTLVFDGKSTDGSNVDILEKIFDNGDQIIKEVYWQNNRSTKEREVMKTVVKTIVDETMTVTEVHKKKYSKGERGKQSEQVISAFKIEYEIIGSEQIKKFNERVHGTNIVPAKNSFIMPNLTTEFVPIEKNNYKLIDIIANEKLAVKGGTKLNTEVKNTKLSQEFKTYEASVSGADFKSESDRLFLPIMEIMKHIKSVDSFLSTRHKNLSGHEWFIAHAAISDTTPEAVGNLKSEYESVDTKGIELFLQKVARKNIANNIRYLNEKVYRLGDTPYEYNNDHIKTVKNGMELAFKSTFKTSYLIGAEKNTALRSIYEDISLHNSGSYDKTSVITVLGRDGNAVKQNGQLVSDYKNIDKAIKKDASFVLELISLDFQTTMNSVGRLKLTDGALIKYFYQINSKKKGKFTKDLQHEKSKYQLQNYLLNNGYKSRLENGILVFSPKDLGYNSKIKSNYEARQIVENIMNCK